MPDTAVAAAAVDGEDLAKKEARLRSEIEDIRVIQALVHKPILEELRAVLAHGDRGEWEAALSQYAEEKAASTFDEMDEELERLRKELASTLIARGVDPAAAGRKAFSTVEELHPFHIPD